MDWVFTGDLLEAMMKALPVTLSLTAISFTLALVLAILIAIVEYFKVPILDRIFSLYVSFFRGTPLIPQLFLLYFWNSYVCTGIKECISILCLCCGFDVKFSGIYERSGQRITSFCSRRAKRGGISAWNVFNADNVPDRSASGGKGGNSIII